MQNGILFLVLYINNRNLHNRVEIFQSISDHIQRFPRVVFLGDLNEERDNVQDFMIARGMTRLWTDPTFNATRNGAPHFNDVCYFKNLDISLEQQIVKTSIGGDHSGLLIKIKRGKP